MYLVHSWKICPIDSNNCIPVNKASSNSRFSEDVKIANVRWIYEKKMIWEKQEIKNKSTTLSKFSEKFIHIILIRTYESNHVLLQEQKVG